MIPPRPTELAPVRAGDHGLLRACMIVAVFGALGPPIGGLVAWTTMGAASLRSPLPFLVGSYGEGLALALGTGLLVAIATVWFAGTSWLIPVAAALLVNAVAILVAFTSSESMSLDSALRTLRVFLPPSLVAAVACWLVARALSMLLVRRDA